MKGQSVNVLLAIYAIVSRIDAQRTSTVTRTTTTVTFVTVTSRSSVVCAKLVNVTGVCRRRRGLPIDEPVILTFDDELEDSVDQAFHRVLDPNQFIPTTTLGVEVTPVVLLPVQTTVHSNDYYQLHSLPGAYSSPSTTAVVRPSIVNERRRNSGRNKLMSSQPDEEEGGAEQKIYFVQLGQFFNSVLNQIRPVTTTRTITSTRTRTTTTTSFTTATFFVMMCTPSPFPYAVCPAKRSHDH
ncbi:uncharacterized protein LOC130698161 [Daphnia carinata]|uniref:uncharacterized protein LOC130698161 n=1 Tax=Daphnia carinata TaxID=120202 RepID=UPI00257F05D2|nr:uncharacterized protein LOC130698161 [Daphnia carinata]